MKVKVIGFYYRSATSNDNWQYTKSNNSLRDNFDTLYDYYRNAKNYSNDLDIIDILKCITGKYMYFKVSAKNRIPKEIDEDEIIYLAL